MKHKVGQVLYVVLRKDTRVYPMQVIEEITKKTLTGEEKSYVVQGGSDASKQLMLNEIDGEIFDSAEKAKTVLIDRATGHIVKLVEQAIRKAKEWYPNSFEESSDDPDPMSLIKKPANAPPLPQRQTARRLDPMSELAQELQAESAKIAGESPVVMLPDGTKVKVKLPEPTQ